MDPSRLRNAWRSIGQPEKATNAARMDQDAEDRRTTKRPQPEDDFQLPKKTARPQPDRRPTATATSSRYTPLRRDIEEPEMDTRTRRTERPPPVIVDQGVEDAAAFHAEIKRICPGGASVRYRQNSTAVYCTRMDDYMRLRAALQEQKTGYYTYASRSERTKKLVLVGMPPLDEEEITQAIKEKHPGFIRMSKMKTRGNRRTILYLVYFSAQTNIGLVKQTKELLYCKVSWEHYRKGRDIAQCRRCQNFGHGSSNCQLQPRCVKCTGSHLTKDCTKKDDEPAECTNCQGAHTAASTDCPAYLRLLESKRTRHNGGRQAQQPPQPRRWTAATPPAESAWSRGPPPQWRTTRTEPTRPAAEGRPGTQVSTLGTTERMPGPTEQHTDDATSLFSVMNEIRSMVNISALTTTMTYWRDLLRRAGPNVGFNEHIQILDQVADRWTQETRTTRTT